MVEVCCPHCRRRSRLKTPVADGTTLNCPHCLVAFRYPGAKPPLPIAVATAAPPLPPAEEPRQPCPFCGERIIVGAKKCRFCNEVLDPVLRSGREGVRGASPPPFHPGFAWMAGTFFGYVPLIIPGIIVHVLCVINAASEEKE